MLLCYAAECGLKYAVMRREALDDTSLLTPTHCGQDGHDLRKLLQRLKVGHSVFLRLPEARTANNKGEKVGPSSYHQAWRFGIDITDEEKIQEVFGKVFEWLDRELG